MQEFHFPNGNITYTKAEQKIADFLMQSSSELFLLSIHDISKRLGVSEATISRFTRHVGYQDFKELKSDLLSQLEENKSPAEKLSTSLLQDNSSLIGMLRYQQFCIEKTMEHLEDAYVQTIINTIVSARHIFLFGKGAASSLAELLRFRLSRFGMDVTVFPSGGSEIFETLNFITKDDFIILFGFQRTPAEAGVILKHSKILGCKTLLITSRILDDTENTADYQLFVYRGQPKEYHSMSAPMALLDALVILIAAKLNASATDSLEDLHRLKETYKKEIPR